MAQKEYVPREEYEAVIAAQETLQRYIADLTREKTEIFEEIDQLLTFLVDGETKYLGINLERYTKIKKKHTEVRHE